MSNLILPNQEKKLVQAVPNGTVLAPQPLPPLGIRRNGDRVEVIASLAGVVIQIGLPPAEWRKFRAAGDAIADEIEPEVVELAEAEEVKVEVTA